LNIKVINNHYYVNVKNVDNVDNYVHNPYFGTFYCW